MNLLLAVSGSIAAYKAYDLTRSLVKKNHTVRVMLTHGALEFVKPEVFRYLGAEACYLPTDDFNSPTVGVPHIDIGKWAEKLVLAPASANTIARLARGEAGDFLASLFLAWRRNKPMLIFPAMNTMMWSHEFTQDNIQKLQKLSFLKVIDPASGLLACGDEGAGKLMEVEAMSDLIEIYNPLLKIEKKVLITTGATVSPMDPIRFITNPSSGLTGVEIAKAYLTQGASVTLLVGYNPHLELLALKAHPHCQVIHTPRTKQMHEMALKVLKDADTVIASAAVADFEFNTADTKIKKSKLQTLELMAAPDILSDMLQQKSSQKFVSFAAETDTSDIVFKEKFTRKPVDLMIGNSVHSGLIGDASSEGFQALGGQYWFITSQITNGPEKLTKKQLAQKICDWDLSGINP
jgi:phosphopantothenoylcysteine decarboxylase / phosphopantothenate---cysteine ligase